MTALRVSSLPDHIRNEMARLKAAGHHLLPLGGGADGKAPLVGAWAGPSLSLGRILAPMYRTGLQAYGVRLDGLAVIDCGSDDSELVAQMEARFGSSTVHVKTPRGRHLYYRSSGVAPNLRGEGFPVDIKTGPRSYVAGPLSQRPDGGLYGAAKGLLGKDGLTLLRTSASPTPAPILTGHRHVELVKEAMRMVELVDTADELQANLTGIRDDWCVDPATMPDSKLHGIAEWVWKCRLENRIYRGRDSAFPINRHALDALRRWDNETDAIALYVLLVDQHGHATGKRFALNFKAMRSSGLIRLSIPRLRAARRTLEAVGLLAVVGNHRAGSVHRTYTLTRLRPASGDVSNISTMQRLSGTGKAERRV